ncbi:hypothetical protein H104_02113 [Trichophyton rubrum CBS 289.86]|nr:hypothetical protein H104_02113 [Trichophyton rubrum CBS 289.86]
MYYFLFPRGPPFFTPPHARTFSLVTNNGYRKQNGRKEAKTTARDGSASGGWEETKGRNDVHREQKYGEFQSRLRRRKGFFQYENNLTASPSAQSPWDRRVRSTSYEA